MSAQTTQVDIVIVGAGMVGATLAWGLLQAVPELAIALVDGSALKSSAQNSDNHPSFDHRALALSANTVGQLQRWGLWSGLGDKAAPITDIQVSDRGHFGAANLHAEKLGARCFGQVLEVQPFGESITAKLSSHPQVQWFAPDTVVEVAPAVELTQLTLASGHRLNCQLLVVADGGKSTTRDKLGVTASFYPYEQTAVIANLMCEQPHNGWAFERFTSQGPLALLPMSGGRTSLVWCLSAERAAEVQQLSDTQFIAELQQVAGYRLGRINKVGQRDSYPLQLMRTDHIVRHRSVVLGNAAHALHPIAGQGFNLGMRDVQCLVELIKQAKTVNSDIGGYELLRQYRDQREPDIQQVVQFTDGLCRLFSNGSRVLALSRSSGLAALQFITPLQKPVAELGMGLVARSFLSGHSPT
ncbi:MULTISPECIES: 2-octaprenyl-6-methoxyphenyl hydroxylase [Corallincola]|uniref:2-octaprenyl-6-methoxyphenyl hydroxylase n=2 Tax=Corallincola TaxID=1775176 RepID=A0ABY1WLI8_9GAMM|nr:MULTISPECIES: 2-octaprenyl-6-methoxyphenyl hydroxylase [Corallincola]TAA41794.1 2-octaprenyl-6-methoxyphenyl hydroxylase [Corallincola spongiicola]TCI02215.1 2-octaprenyl-6-methoxyphenyl hydroxylase [Corallincola luteus]